MIRVQCRNRTCCPEVILYEDKVAIRDGDKEITMDYEVASELLRQLFYEVLKVRPV